MKNVAIFGGQVDDLASRNPSIGTLEMDGIPVTVGVVPTPSSDVEKDLLEKPDHVVIRVKAFSCNYRDKALIFSAAKSENERSFYVIGSELVGEVVNVGPAVTSLQIGDRVIGNNHYHGFGIDTGGAPEGMPTNHGSKEYQILHQNKLMKIPSNMPDEVGAVFSLGAQTAYSMIRKLQVKEGDNVLVTAAKSNTSLFAIQALQKYRANVYVTTTSQRFEKELQDLGVKEVFVVSPDLPYFNQHVRMTEVAKRIGLFDCVIDPFYDLHIGKVIHMIGFGGRYVTCGLFNQYQSLIDQEFQYIGSNLIEVMGLAMLKNIQIIGNCLGSTQDLERALQDYEDGVFDVSLDSVFYGNQVVDFFDRTFNARDRFGKVAFQYD